MDALVSRILPLLSGTPPHGRELARLRRSGPRDCRSESREGVLMDAGRTVRVRPGHREVRDTRPSLSPSRPGMMGWTAPRTASACQDGRCQNPSEGKPSMGRSIRNLSTVTRVGLDLAKRVFQVHAVEAKGEIVVARKLTPGQRRWKAVGGDRVHQCTFCGGGPTEAVVGCQTAMLQSFGKLPSAGSA